MQSYAILIDGGFAKRKLGTAWAPATADDFKRLVDVLRNVTPLAGQRLHRVYYYDSAPLESSHDKPLGGGRVEFGNSPVASKSRKLFEQLAEQPYMALRLGELVLEGWEINASLLRNAQAPSIEVRAEDLRPQITQKGVDMRIGMDIAALTLKRLVQTIVLVSGDSDFVPAMKFARREGVHLYLCSLGQRVKPSMREHSDLLLEIAQGPRHTHTTDPA